jgi:hypothetical protein
MMIAGTTDWRLADYEFVVTNTTDVQVIIGLGARTSGTAWFDNIRLDKVFSKFVVDDSPGIVQGKTRGIKEKNSDKNIVAKPSFEDGAYATHSIPDSWHISGYDLKFDSFVWDDRVHKNGKRSIRITNEQPNDSMWYQVVRIRPLTNYKFTGGSRGKTFVRKS